MLTVLGQLLPLAVGVAISPIPIIAVILMLMSPKAASTSVGFAVGWLAGIVVATTVFTLVSSVLPESGSDGPRPVAGSIKVVAGLMLVFLAVRQWRGRPAPGETAKLPTWMSAVDKITTGKAAGLGFLLSAVNPKNLLMAISSGLIIGGAALGVGSAAVAIIVFTVIAGCTVLVPVIGYLFARNAMATPLQSLRDWLLDNNATIMAVLLLLIGAVVIGKGIADFS